jgi:hypothetical protein
LIACDLCWLAALFCAPIPAQAQGTSISDLPDLTDAEDEDRIPASRSPFAAGHIQFGDLLVDFDAVGQGRSSASPSGLVDVVAMDNPPTRSRLR